MKLDIDYLKPDATLFTALKTNNVINVKNIQNYVPAYQQLFKLNKSNFNSINLKNTHYIREFNSKLTNNTYNVSLNNNEKKDIFIKYSPILDPSKYLMGKYGDLPEHTLPKFEESNMDSSIKKKINNPYNSSYIDGCFSYLSSQIVDKFKFSNGIKFYGCYLANKNDFRYNLDEDIMYVHNSDFFNKHINKAFYLDEEYKDLFNSQSRSNNAALTISENDIELTDIKKIENEIKIEEVDQTITLIEEFQHKKKTSSLNSSNCSSNISLTSNEEEDEEDEEEDDKGSDKGSDKDEPVLLNIEQLSSIEKKDKDKDSTSCNSSESSRSGSSLSRSSSIGSDLELYINIPNFPTNIICLEKCENTLDSYMNHNEIKELEWAAILFQVIFTLLTYQKLFNFTHNDLHTNNIMYVNTEKEYLYYHYKKEYFKVPTFGKIWKIIDFGRAIYTINNEVLYSDSFEKGEDAYSQYNFDKFRNKEKKEIAPNYSFDLCRLGCSLYEYFFEESDMNSDNIHIADNLSKIKYLVKEWCNDDENRNVLFKANGEERYPDFKLYKMIARTVNNHTPEAQLSRSLFKNFSTSKKKINNKKAIFSLDHILFDY